MTSELRPWLQEPGGDPGVRALLESAEVDAPNERQLERLTAKVAFLFDLPPGGGDGGDGGPDGGGAPEPTAGTPAGAPAASGQAVTGAAGATGLGMGVKAVIAASVLGAAGLGLVVATRTPEQTPGPVVAPPAVVPSVPSEPAPAEPVKTATPEPEPSKRASPPAPAPPKKTPVVQKAPQPIAPPPTPPEADEELAGLDEAMKAARAGRPADALAAVDAHAARFPQSALAQEREVIGIEALVALGRPDDARARLARFRARWPTSSHLVRLDGLLP
jgi:hypothetical protein